MFLNKNISKIAIVFMLIFLCSEMPTSFTQQTTFEDYNTITNSIKASFSNGQHHASVRLKARNQDFADVHVCSGVVIGPSVILTTAQCVHNYKKNKPYHPSELKVVLASVSHYHQQAQSLTFSVTHSYQADHFNALTLNDNLAILLLDRDIPKTNEHVKPLALSHTKEVNNNTNWYDKQNGGELKVTTWLKTDEGITIHHLMLVNVSQVSDDICIKYYGKKVFGAGMLCVDSNEPLGKDLGSPLFVDNVLVGVKSFAYGQLSPAIYTDVSHHAKWIRSIIGDGSNQNGSIWGTLSFLLLTFVAFKRSAFVKF